MQTSFLERHAEDILGACSCFDRIIIQGTLPDIAYADAMTLTALGKLIVAASLKLKEMTLIPLLRGQLLPA